MTIIQQSGVCLVTEESCVYVFGRKVSLSLQETMILELLMNQNNISVTRDQILDLIGDHGDILLRAVDTRIKRLRRKLFPENIQARHLFIQTTYKGGYKIFLRRCAD